MARRSPKPADLNAKASSIVAQATSEPEPESVAVSSGRRGGKARAERLTPEQRRESARKATDARWKTA